MFKGGLLQDTVPAAVTLASMGESGGNPDMVWGLGV